MSEELRLPPHIEMVNGLYKNTITGRWIGAYKIEQVCREYWENEGESPTVVTGDGTVGYKKNFTPKEKETTVTRQGRKIKRKVTRFKRESELVTVGDEDFDIIPNPNIGREDELFENLEEVAKPMEFEEFEDDEVLITQNSVELESKPADSGEKKFTVVSKENLPTERPITEKTSVVEEVDISALMTIKSAAVLLKHTAAYIYQLLQKGSLDEVEVDGIKFVTIESVERRKKEYVDQNKKIRAEKASKAARDKNIPKMNPVEIIKPFVEIIDKRDNVEKSEAEKFFESPIYENSVSFLFNIENHDSLNVIIQGVCDQWKVDFEYMRFKIRVDKIPSMDDVWYEEIMAMICHALWTRLPIANRIDWLSGYLNRTPIQVRALLGIFYREEHTKKGNWYNYKENDSSWWEWANEFSFALDDYFLPFYRFDYTYKYYGKKK